jgi:hypothetical protein
MNPSCKQCGQEVEDERVCYATPTCFACLPPPAPLPVRHKRGVAAAPSAAHVQILEHGDDGRVRRWCSCGYRGEWHSTILTAMLTACTKAGVQESLDALESDDE